MKTTNKLAVAMCALTAIYWCGCAEVKERQVVARDQAYTDAHPDAKPSSIELKNQG